MGKVRVGFWNVARIKNKTRAFWKYIGEWDVINLMETWVGEAEWEKLKEEMPEEFRWKIQMAKWEGGRGRVAGEIITGVRKGLEEEVVGNRIEGVQVRRVKIGEENGK